MKKPKVTRRTVKPGRDTMQERAEEAVPKWKSSNKPHLLAEDAIRIFDTGATRDIEDNKLDYEAFLSPQAIECFALYMDFHRNLPDGSRRDGDNWQKGFPNLVLIKSLWRHFFSFWRWCRFAYYGDQNKSLARPFQHPLIDLCGIMFNVQAYMRQMIEADPESMNEMLRIMKLEREQRLRKASP